MRNRAYFLLLLIPVWLCSCEKEELPVPAHATGEVTLGQAAMGSDYRNQLFFYLDENAFVQTLPKTDWDVGFEANESGAHIILNSARGGGAAATGTPDFSAVTTAAGAEWRWDATSGNLDSTAIAANENGQEVWLIDRGYDASGNHTGYRKMIVETITATAYTIRFAHLDGSDEHTLEIPKSESVNFVCLSFTTNAVVEVEPDKDQWDLLFTQYIHLFQDPLTPYLVTGVLINPNGVEVAIEATLEFETITLEVAQGFSFQTARNVIGYDWKRFDFATGAYTVFPEITYLIKDTEGRYFKFHFVDFYNEQGEKGFPKFEFQEL